jgi:hypothetical protein
MSKLVHLTLVFAAGVEASESRRGCEEGRCTVLHIQHEGRASKVSDDLCVCVKSLYWG